MTPGPAGFPDDRSLCEACGYPLVGLAVEGSCPECGLPVGESSPARRTGLPWQHRRDAAAWWATVSGLLLSPGVQYRRMRLGGSGVPERLFLMGFAVLVGMLWAVIWMTAGERRWWLWGVMAAGCVVALTYIETLGVTSFSQRRGWRVPWRLAERVACYAAVAWLPAGLIMAKAILLLRQDFFARTVPIHFLLGIPDDTRDLLLVILIAVVAMLWFETLVWLGVRRVRYGNEDGAQSVAPVTHQAPQIRRT
ncbi:MAG: hypothetical protein K8S99_02310 [Planctomycetes bacterium]|nr:hypothetical protein [Planctomycetota bacterium]